MNPPTSSHLQRHRRRAAHLVLADGTVFNGEAIGAGVEDEVIATGEVVFNTSMYGYQEIITDPSYAGQVIAFTYPHIGNYGVTPKDDEARRPFCRGVVFRDLAVRPSSWRATASLEEFLVSWSITGITGVDTRRLTRHIRDAGAMSCALGSAPVAELLAAAGAEPGTLGAELVSQVTTDAAYVIEGEGDLHIVAYDFGIKTTMLDQLRRIANVTVVPASTTASDVLAKKPDGVLLSNGPGDPAALGHLLPEIKALLGNVPVFGICLGHQLLASVLGATTHKLVFGHHGGNHPVQRVATGAIEVTSQNHGFAVTPDSLRGAEITHVNLNDGVIEGLASRELAAFSVQYHPEAGPGPHDAGYLFEEFRELMETHR